MTIFCNIYHNTFTFPGHKKANHPKVIGFIYFMLKNNGFINSILTFQN